MFQKLKLFVCIFCAFSCLSFADESARKKRVVVYTDIAGDMLHAGHIEFFKKARAFGDYFIVGVLADDVIEGYKRHPVLTLEERVAMVSACKYVDEVIVAPPLRLTEEMIKDLDITYVVRGDDFSKELLEDQYPVPLKLGILRFVPYTKGISTTEIIKRITDRYDQGEFRSKPKTTP
jgi:cytidyltransferase-like protein